MHIVHVFLCCTERLSVAAQKVEDGTQQTQTQTHQTNHNDTTSQQGGNDKSSEQQSKGEMCKWVMAKANSLNEVNGRDYIADVPHARVSLDAESGTTANRRRRKRYSPSCNNTQKVGADNAYDIIS